MVRFKNRWLLVELVPLDESKSVRIDGKKIWSALKQSIVTNFGDTGWGCVGLSLIVKYYSPMTNICIIRTARDHHNIAWAGVTLMTSIEGCPILPHMIHVSGTIKHAQLAAIAHNREVIARYRADANRPAAYQDVYEGYLATSSSEIEALRE